MVTLFELHFFLAFWTEGVALIMSRETLMGYSIQVLLYSYFELYNAEQNNF